LLTLERLFNPSRHAAKETSSGVNTAVRKANRSRLYSWLCMRTSTAIRAITVSGEAWFQGLGTKGTGY
jgi:hypothetical protein